MNTADFQQTGGLPLETNTLDFMQSAYSIFNAFGALAGDKTIVSGCEIQGVNITNGYIFYNNELLFFKGGIKQNTIVIIEQKQEVEFEDKTLKDVYKTRYATFGVSGNSIPWGNFKRYYINQPIYREVKWVDRDVTNEDLPRGWFIANGQNGTRNLLGRMIVGKSTEYEFNSLGKTGGEKSHKLTVDELPKHTPSGVIDSAGNHRHSYTHEDPIGSGSNKGSANGFSKFSTRYTGFAGSHSHTLRMNEIGGNKTHNNLPPYIVQIPIQFIG